MHMLLRRWCVIIVEGDVVIRLRTYRKNEHPWAVGPVNVPGMLQKGDAKAVKCVGSGTMGGQWRPLGEAAKSVGDDGGSEAVVWRRRCGGLPAVLGGWRLG